MTQTVADSNHTARALSLLGSGVTTEATAAALGVTPSAISQLLANDEFSEQVVHLRYENLQQHNKRDSKYDDIEDRLLKKLSDTLGLIMRPEMILRALATINNAKRRGQSAPEQVSESATILNLTLPAVVVQKFTTNINNQVVQAGDQSLHTLPSASLLEKLKTVQAQAAEALPNLGDTSEQQIEVASQG